MEVRIQIFGDEQFARKLERVGEHGGDLRPVWDVIEEDIKQIGAAQFMTQGGRSSGGWTPLAESTQLRKQKQGSGFSILQETGALRDAVASFSDPNQQVVKTEDWMVFRVVGDPGEYGAFHQSGTSKMPMRKVLEFTELDRIRFVNHIQRYVITGEVDWID